MSLFEAVRRDVALWPGNQESLSQAMYGSPQTLRHKLSGHRNMLLGLEEALELMQLTQGRETIKALARESGGVYLEIPALNLEIGNEELHLAMLQVTESLGQLNAEIFRALSDDQVIDEREKSRIDLARHKITERLLRYVGMLYRVHGNNEVHANAFGRQR